MTGEPRDGHYRIISKDKKKIRFFWIYKTSQGIWKIKEYEGGDLYRLKSVKKGKPSVAFWAKLVTW